VPMLPAVSQHNSRVDAARTYGRLKAARCNGRSGNIHQAVMVVHLEFLQATLIKIFLLAALQISLTLPLLA